MDTPLQSGVTLPMDAIRAYCEKWQITEMALFGSVLREDFHAESDIDVLVTFAEDARYSLFDMVHMAEELESLFGRNVDLLTRGSIERSDNYLRRNEILGTAQVIYGS